VDRDISDEHAASISCSEGLEAGATQKLDMEPFLEP